MPLFAELVHGERTQVVEDLESSEGSRTPLLDRLFWQLRR